MIRSLYRIINPLSVPMHMRMDYLNRNQVLLALKVPCSWCEGTGNQFVSMFSRCPVCGGSGITPAVGLLAEGQVTGKRRLREKGGGELCGNQSMSTALSATPAYALAP